MTKMNETQLARCAVKLQRIAIDVSSLIDVTEFTPKGQELADRIVAGCIDLQELFLKDWAVERAERKALEAEAAARGELLIAQRGPSTDSIKSRKGIANGTSELDS